jgi:hypothetical protein
MIAGPKGQDTLLEFSDVTAYRVPGGHNATHAAAGDPDNIKSSLEQSLQYANVGKAARTTRAQRHTNTYFSGAHALPSQTEPRSPITHGLHDDDKHTGR